MLILEEFYKWGIHPTEKPLKHSREYMKALERLSASEKKLRSLLSEEQIVIFEEYIQKSDEICSIDSCESFIMGFQMSGKFIIDILTDGVMKDI